MSTLFSRDWTGDDDDLWTAHGFIKAQGPAVEANIQSNQGWCGSAAGGDRVYVASGYPQTPNYIVRCDHTWKNAAGAGRIGGMAVRFTTAGGGYTLEVDSNVGTTRVRVRRWVAGTPTTISGWTDISSTVGSARLNSGETIKARVENTDSSTVSLKLWIGSDLVVDITDTNAARIESGGRAGVFVDANSATDDIIYDDLDVLDFEDEYAGDPDDLDADVALVVDGVHYAWADLQAAGIRIGIPKQSYTETTTAELFDDLKLGETSTILYPGAVVTIALDGTIVARGRLRTATQEFSPGEGRKYDLADARALAADVLVQDPDWGSGTIRFNMPADQDDYDSARADLEIGQIIAYLIDNHLDGDGYLRDQLAAPPDASAYTQAELDAMDAVIPELQVQGDILTAVETLLSYTEYALFINPSTLAWEFHERNAGGISQVDLADSWVEGEGIVSPDRNFTAVLIRGSRPEETDTTLTNLVAGGLDEGWPAALAGTHNQSLQFKNTDSGTVDSTGTGGGKITMTPAAPFSMDADEWLMCLLTFEDGAEAGNSYPVYDNTSGTFTLDAASWISGGPSPGDAFTVRGNKAGGGRDNGHRILGRRFTLTDATRGIRKGACGSVTMEEGGISVPLKFTHHTPADPSEPAEIELDLPAIGLINRATVADPCDDGDTSYVEVADIELSIPTYDRTDPSVPTYRYPTSGFYGTAFAEDASKYSGGGKPGRGDAAVMRVYPLDVQGYTGSAAQDAEMAKLAQSLLAVLSPLSREVRITLNNVLDTSWAGLDARLQLVRTGGSTGVWESLTDLGVLAVEWDPLAKTTTLYAGTIASGDYDIQAMRARFLAKSQWAHAQQGLEQIRQLLACIGETPKGSGDIGQLAPSQLCGGQITVSTPTGARNVNVAVENIENQIDIIINWCETVLGNLGKTVDDDGNEIEPGTTLGPGETGTHYNPDGTTDDLGEGDVVPDTELDDLEDAIDGILNQLGKTTSGTDGSPDTILPPGSTVGAEGGTYHGPDGTDTTLGPGDTVPPTITEQIQAEKEMKGLDELLDDPSGPIAQGPEDPGPHASSPTRGLYAVTEGAGGGYEGAHYRSMQAATGGPGTGINGGDYEVKGDSVRPRPRVHKQFDIDSALVSRGGFGGGAIGADSSGYGVKLPASAHEGFVTRRISIPAYGPGYAHDQDPILVITYHSQGGTGTGSFTVDIYGECLELGQAPSGLSVIDSSASLPNPGATKELATYRTTLPRGSPTNVGNGGVMHVGIDRDDANPDDLIIDGIDVEIPVEADFIEV